MTKETRQQMAAGFRKEAAKWPEYRKALNLVAKRVAGGASIPEAIEAEPTTSVQFMPIGPDQKPFLMSLAEILKTDELRIQKLAGKL